MTFGEMVRKMMKYSWRQYLFYCCSIFLAVTMIEAYGVLMFSPTVTDVLLTDGSTYMISCGMYGITIVGIVVFVFYANGMYLGIQKRQMGVFLALGMKNEIVAKVEGKEFDQLFWSSSLFGVIMGIPVAWMLWSFLSLFIKTTESAFSVGWKGVGIAILLCVFLWSLLRIRNSRQMKHMEIIGLLHAQEQKEEVKAGNGVFGIIGFLCIPVGLILFNLSAISYTYKKFSMIFLGVTIVGMYLFVAHITLIGEFIRKIANRRYLKNLLFYNLVRQKGNQYTLALFVSSLLIGLTVFAFCFNGAGFIEMYAETKEDPYDYMVLTGIEQKSLDENRIREIAEEDGVNITEWKSLKILMIGREHQYKDTSRNEWSGDFAVSVSQFNQLAGMNLVVEEGTYSYFDQTAGTTFQTLSEEYGVFYNPTQKEDFRLKKGELLNTDGIMNHSAAIQQFVILSDSDFVKLMNSCDEEYQLDYYLFNGSQGNEKGKLQQDLLQEVVGLSHGIIKEGSLERTVQDKRDDLVVSEFPYEGNELYAARWWEFYPYARENSMQVQLESGAVYLLLVLFISIIAFLSASMILGMKLLGTITQDEENYRKAVYLGFTRKMLNRLITKQMGFIWFFPALCGCSTACVMVRCFMDVSSITHVNTITWLAVGISMIVLLIQSLVFFIMRRKVTHKMSRVCFLNVGVQ